MTPVEPRTDSRATVDLRTLLVGFLIVACAFALYVWLDALERDTLRSLPEAERRALFEQTRASVETVCRVRRDEAATSLCAEQAERLLQFPECDADCRARANEHARRATR